MNSKYIHFVASVLIVTIFCALVRSEELSVMPARTARPIPNWRDATLDGLPGVAVPSLQVIMSCPMEGMLMELHVREGQRVEAGQILAVMDNRVAQAAVAAARAGAERLAPIELARQELLFSQNLLQRLEALRTANAGSDFELLEAQYARRQGPGGADVRTGRAASGVTTIAAGDSAAGIAQLESSFCRTDSASRVATWHYVDPR